MSEDYQSQARAQTDRDLPAWTAGWGTGTYPRLCGELELRCREARTDRLRSNLAIALSILSLLVSLLSAVL